MDRRAWRGTVSGVAERDVSELLNSKTTTCEKAQYSILRMLAEAKSENKYR